MSEQNARKAPGASGVPGAVAEAPTEIPARGWRQVLKRAWKEGTEDNIGLLAAGVAFFGFLALFPAIIALITVVGLVADPQTIAEQVRSATSGLPQGAQQILTDQLSTVTQSSSGALSLTLVVSLLLALWSASAGVSNLMKAVNIAYDEREKRGFVKLRATALVITIGAVVFLILTLALVAVVPIVLNALPLGSVGTVLAQVLRWALLIALVVLGLAVVYRLAPDRGAPKWSWVTTGSVAAALLWLLGSVLFSYYMNNFGNYNKTYGALAGVIILMLWLYLTSYIVLLGAEINAESERQTARDTTTGEPVPMGQRDAVAADTVAGEPDNAARRSA